MSKNKPIIFKVKGHPIKLCLSKERRQLIINDKITSKAINEMFIKKE